MSRHIIYIINPVSGTEKKEPLHQLVASKTQEAGIPFLIVPSESDGNYRHLIPVIQAHRTTDVIIAGGDGTVSQVIGALIDSGVQFGILPCGSGNGLAFASGIPKNAAEALDIIFKNEARLTDGFYVNGKFACMLCGVGFDAQVAHDFARKTRRGLTTYVRQVMKNFLSAKPYTFKIDTGSQVFGVNAFFISVANSNQYGNHFTIAPKASLDDGLLDVVIVNRQNKLLLLYQTIRQVRGKIDLQTTAIARQTKGVFYFQTPTLVIENKSLAPFHIDGEAVETSDKFTIRISPQCFRLLRPVTP